MKHYTTLGISPDASSEEIRRAYRILARRYHPDVNPGVDSKSKFQKISEAYSILSDPQKRTAYDFENQINSQPRSKPKPGSTRRRPPPTGGRFEPPPTKANKRGFFDEVREIFRDVTAKVTPTKASSSRAKSPQKVSVLEISLDIREAIKGGTKQVELAEPEGRRTISITIPAGVKSGDIIRLNGKQAREELIAVVRILPDSILSITRKGILIELPVTVEEALMGASIMVPTLDEPVMLKIPPSSQSGTELRLKGKGVPNRTTKEKGDLIFKLAIKLPDNPSATTLAAAKILTPEYGNTSVRANLPKTLV